MASGTSQLIWGLLLLSIDCLISVFLSSWHGPFPSVASLSSQFPFSFFTSTIDLLLLTFIRALLYILPSAFITSGNGYRLPTVLHVEYSFSLLMYAASPTKLLFLHEKLGADEVAPIGDYLFLAWNAIAALIMDISWRTYFSHTPSTYVTLNENEEDENQSPRETFQLILRLLQYCKREWVWHVSGFTWLFIYSLTRIFVPYYTGQVVASVVETQDHTALKAAVYVMTVISFISAIAGGLRGGSFEYAYARINRAIRFDLFTGLVRQDIAFYDAHKTGEIASRLTADCQTMSDTVALNVNVFLRNIVMLFGSMLFMMSLSWRLSLITFILVPIIFVASKIFGTYYDLLSERTQNAIADSNDVAEEVLSTMRTVRSFACERVEGDRFYEKLTVTLAVTRTKAIAYVGFIWVSEVFQTFIIVAVLWYGGHLVLSGKMKKELLVSFLLYQMQLGDNLRQMGEVWTGLMQSVGASRKVFEYIDREPSIQHHGTCQQEVRGKIEFRNVHFSYPTRPHQPILRDLSFTVEPGETVALVGPSGSGKSSCIALLENFYQPNAGQVLIDGMPLEEYEHHYIHRKIALVGQEPILFARSVHENVSYGLDGIPMEDIINSSKMANAHDFILQTTNKYETNVGEKGSQMSGGQKQRIAIARALVRGPAILLLDEATSALDTESEHVVQEAIYKNLDGKSVILIAHRLSTVEKADKIIVIHKGRVEEMGNHDSLLKKGGIYANLVHRQMMADSKETPSSIQSSSTREVEVSRALSISPSNQNTTKSLLGTSFTQSNSSFQSK
ncbi:haf-4 [Pristionchus pacificus]|uniref:ABC-type antigen peptide transporter n=1 Tax=Pristionchus pacificus TaxID=54126 RepID=A0A2A6BLX2_PRIPA|nr:haf-4 [Pristionchus pacificus]|eukprot:PDM66899.1 haf-4 [Pristionchus pacificus]